MELMINCSRFSKCIFVTTYKEFFLFFFVFFYLFFHRIRVLYCYLWGFIWDIICPCKILMFKVDSSFFHCSVTWKKYSLLKNLNRSVSYCMIYVFVKCYFHSCPLFFWNPFVVIFMVLYSKWNILNILSYLMNLL